MVAQNILVHINDLMGTSTSTGDPKIIQEQKYRPSDIRLCCVESGLMPFQFKDHV